MTDHEKALLLISAPVPTDADIDAFCRQFHKEYPLPTTSTVESAYKAACVHCNIASGRAWMERTTFTSPERAHWLTFYKQSRQDFLDNWAVIWARKIIHQIKEL